MANHKSALKRIRANETKRLRNRYQHKTTRTYIRKLRSTTEQAAAVEVYKTVSSMLDRLAKKNVIHKNKANNQKSKLAKYVKSLAPAAWFFYCKNFEPPLTKVGGGFLYLPFTQLPVHPWDWFLYASTL